MRKQVMRFLILILLTLGLISSCYAEGAELVYQIPITGEIDSGLVKLVTRGIKEAEDKGADLLVFEIDTYGGLVDSGIKIKELIFKTDISTVCYVNGRAWSAGALIALAGEKIAMLPGSSIGAAETRPKEEKYISAFRKEFKATAERRAKNGDLAAAMVDADIEIEGITEKGKLVTLTAQEALKYNIADYNVSSLNDLYDKLEIIPARIIKITPTSAEKLARIVTNPTVSIILLTVGFLAIIFEVFTAGWGVGGTIGLISLGLFFSGYIINGVASWGLVILFLVGLVLMALEVFVVPGFGITGIGGIIAVFVSLFYLFPSTEIALTVLATVLILSIAGIIVIVKYFGGSRLWKRISLGTSQTKEAGYIAQKDKKDLIGKKGLAVTPLRPAGIINTKGRRLDVISEGGFIDKGEKVEIIKILGNRIIVKPITKEDD